MRYLFLAWLFSAVVLTVSAQDIKVTPEMARQGEAFISSLKQRVTEDQDENARLAAAINDLQRRLSALESSNQSLRQEVTALKTQIAADGEARKNQLDRVEKVIRDSSKPPPAPPRPPSNAQSGTFEEYIVQQGATLSAIAKAYGVTVDEIKKANNLTNDNLRIGQKLLIPVK